MRSSTVSIYRGNVLRRVPSQTETPRMEPTKNALQPRQTNLGPRTSESPAGLLTLALIALLVGATAGAAGAALRLALEHADRLRGALIAWAHGKALAGFSIVLITCTAATMIARASSTQKSRHSQERRGLDTTSTGRTPGRSNSKRAASPSAAVRLRCTRMSSCWSSMVLVSLAEFSKPSSF